MPAKKERPQVPPLASNGSADVLATTASGSHLRQGDVKRKGADLLVAPLKLNVRLSKCGPRSVGRSAVRQNGGTPDCRSGGFAASAGYGVWKTP